MGVSVKNTWYYVENKSYFNGPFNWNKFSFESRVEQDKWDEYGFN